MPARTAPFAGCCRRLQAVSKNAKLEREASKSARSGSKGKGRSGSGGSNPSLAVELVDKGTDTAGLDGADGDDVDVEAGRAKKVRGWPLGWHAWTAWA